MATAVAATADLLISIEYNDAPTEDGTETALAWAILHDNRVMAWLIDDTGAAPVAPVILGSMPPAAPDTGEILSPLWAVRDGSTLYIPDVARCSANELFNFIATNNGANRQLYADFADVNMATAWREWASVNPTLALDAPPNIAVEDVGLEGQRFGGMRDGRPVDIRNSEAAERAAEREKLKAEAEQQPARAR